MGLETHCGRWTELPHIIRRSSCSRAAGAVQSQVRGTLHVPDDAHTTPAKLQRARILPARYIFLRPAGLFQESPALIPGTGEILLANPDARSTRAGLGRLRKARHSGHAVRLPPPGRTAQATWGTRVPD